MKYILTEEEYQKLVSDRKAVEKEINEKVSHKLQSFSDELKRSLKEMGINNFTDAISVVNVVRRVFDKFMEQQNS